MVGSRRSFRRGVQGFGLAILLILAGCQAVYPTVDHTSTPRDIDTPSPTPEPRAHERPMPNYDPPAVPENRSARWDLNLTKVELLVIEEIEERRGEHGVQPVNLHHDPRLSKIARNYSWYMGHNGEFGHYVKDGETINERFERANYDCGPNRIRGGENLAKSSFRAFFYNPDLDTPKPGSVESRLAEGIVEQWMGSDPHRDLLLEDDLSTAGVGVYIPKNKSRYRVSAYTTLYLCY